MPDEDRAFQQQIEATIAEDDPDELVGVIIDVALAARDARWAEGCCLRLAAHGDPTVRGHALIGFVHLAERFGRIDEARVRPTIEAALEDEREYVREQAEAALAELCEKLGWSGGQTG